MPATTPVTVVFIHGLWLHASSWDNWVTLFADRGYQPIAPGWPGDAATAELTRENPDSVANRGIAEITDHFAAIITGLPVPPIVIGHSFGGLIVERLLGMGLGRGGVAIAPAQFHGVHRLPLVQLATAWPVLGHPGNKTKAVPLTQDQFAKGFANAVPREEADDLHQRYGIPSPALPLFEAATSGLSAKTAANVDTKHERGPLLMIAGGDDRTVPEATVHSAFKIQSRNSAVTDYHVFEGRSHSQPVDHGWRDVAEYSLQFLAANDLAAETAAVLGQATAQLVLANPATDQGPPRNWKARPMTTTSQYRANLAETRYAEASSARFAYRRLGPSGDVPLVLVTRFRGTIDHWDPALLDVLSAEREIIVVDYPGVNLSSGATPDTVAGLAGSVAEFIDTLGLQQVDLLGWSMGGYVVQDLCLNRPGLVRRLVIAASGPGAVPGTPAPPDKLRQVAAKPVNDDEDFLYMFFPETEPARRAGLASLRRLDARLTESSTSTTSESVAAQGTALAGWAKGENTSWDRLSELPLPVLVGGGAHDLLMHPYGTYSMALRLPSAKVVLYTDSGHGFLFQHSDDFGQEVLTFTR